MHMADALLSPAVGLAMDALSVAAVGVTVAKVNRDEFSENRVPIIGVAGALVFAGQMINFSIPGTGSSGHIGGGIMLAGMLGGTASFLSLTAVLVIQCLFFADGGLLALGCNIFNMAVIPCLIVYPLIFKPLTRGKASPGRIAAASVISAVIGLELGAGGVVLETWMSGVTQLPLTVFAGLMMPIHLAIGAVEGAVTAGVLCFVARMRPEIIASASEGHALPAVSTKKVIAVLAAAAAFTAGGLSLFASGDPDGLEWSVDKTAGGNQIGTGGVIHDAAESIQEGFALMPDYAFASDPQNPSGTALAGVLGAAVTFALAGVTGFVISKAKKKTLKPGAVNG